MKEIKIEKRLVKDLRFYEGNPRVIAPEMLEKLKKSIDEFGCVEPLVVNTKNEVIGGNQRLKALLDLGVEEVDVVVVDLPKTKEKALNLALNKIQGEWDYKMLQEFIVDLEPYEIELTGFEPQELYNIEFNLKDDKTKKGIIKKKLLYPPFTIFNTRDKYWQEMRQYWYDKYGDDLTKTKDYLLAGGKSGCIMGIINKGVSKFDPFLAQIIYSWFIPKNGGKILNPTCGEPSTGIVAGEMGYEYLGVDIRPEQIEINKKMVEKYNYDKVKYICYDSTRLDELNLTPDFDLVFYSPPYYGIELYSFYEDDISKKGFERGYLTFMDGLGKIIKNSANLLKENRFYIIKLGDVREVLGKNKGILLNFLGDTVDIASECGLLYYNDIILVNAVGTSAYRISKTFKTRKIVKVHQRVLVFYKGDIDKIPEIYEDFNEDDINESLNDFIDEDSIDNIEFINSDVIES